MTKDQILMAQRILETMSRMNDLKDEIRKKYSKLDKNSTQEEVAEFLTFVVQSGFKGLIFDTIMDIRNKIDKDIKQLEEELEAL
jgi:hypothetical protein